MSDLAEPNNRTNNLLVLAQAAQAAQAELDKKKANKEPVDGENNHRKSTRTPVIVSSLEAKRWPVVVTDFSDLLRDKHITNLEDKSHDGNKRIDPMTATPTTVLRHAVDITKKLTKLRDEKNNQLVETRAANENSQQQIKDLQAEIRKQHPQNEELDKRLVSARKMAEAEQSHEKAPIRDRTYSETSATLPKFPKPKKRPRNAASNRCKLPTSFDPLCLNRQLERQHTNTANLAEMHRPKVPKTCQDTNIESLKNRPV